MSTLRSLSVAWLIMLVVGLACPHLQAAVPLSNESMGVLRGGSAGSLGCITNQTCQAPLCIFVGGNCDRCDGAASLYTCGEVEIFGKSHCKGDTVEPSGCGRKIPGAACWRDVDQILRCMYGDPEHPYGQCDAKTCAAW